MLYAGDRKDAAEMIKGWLEEGKVVLLDRYTYSNIAYQCAKLADVREQDKLMNWIFSLEFDHFQIPKPVLNIFLDVPFGFTEEKLSAMRTGDDRNYLNGSGDIHEGSLEFQKSVRDMYLRISDKDKSFAVVNCSSSKGVMLSPDEIFGLIKEILTIRKLI